MRTFKERLLQVVIFVICVGIGFGIGYGVGELLSLINPNLPAFVIFFISLALMTLGVCHFANWLFIEPFRKGRDN